MSIFSTRPLALVPALLLTSLLCAACTEEKKGPIVPPKSQAAPVTVAVAETMDLDIMRYAVGTVRASSTVGVRPRVMGELTSIHFIEGQDVHKGQVLFTIDPRPAEAALLMAKANVERGRVELVKAEDDVRRYKPLVKKNFVSQEQYDQVLATAQSLRASLKAYEAAVVAAELELSYCTITSPVTARAGAIAVNTGNVVKANADEALVTLDSVEPVYVDFAVPEQFLPSIMQQEKALASNGAASSASASSGAPVEAKTEGGLVLQGYVDFVSSSVDSSTGTITLRAIFSNEDRSLWPGQFVTVALSLGKLEKAVAVPVSAVQHGIAGSYVYVVDANNTAQMRVVKAGIKDEGRVEIVTGLAADEKVVTEGHMRLRPEIAVEIKKVLNGGDSAQADSASAQNSAGA